jgi:hypothetical protein
MESRAMKLVEREMEKEREVREGRVQLWALSGRAKVGFFLDGV